MITGLNHITLAVRDLDRSFRFYEEVLGFRALARWPAGAYFSAGELWLALVVDARTREEALPEYTHVALSVADDDFGSAVERVLGSGAKVWKENVSEGPSLYFLDPDGHKLELHVGSLASRLAECSANPWPGLELLVPHDHRQ